MFQDRAQAAAPDLYAYKAADETVTASTTLQDDDHLTVNVKAGGRKYIFRGVIFLELGGSALQGFKVAMGGTTTATFFIASAELSSYVTSLGDEILNSAASSTASVEISGSIEPATDGTFLVQWAQASSSGSATTVKRGSSLSVWRLA